MIKEKVEKLKELKYEIGLEISKATKTTKQCICCDKEVSYLGYDIHPLKQEKGLWNDGSVNIISCGYGSSYDMMKFYFAICDSCIGKKLESGNLENIKDIEKDLNLNLGYESNLL